MIVCVLSGASSGAPVAIVFFGAFFSTDKGKCKFELRHEKI